MDNQELLSKFLGLIKPEVSAANYRAWFSKVWIISQDNQKITLGTPHAFVKQTLKERHQKLIDETLSQLLDKEVIVDFVVEMREGEKENLAEEELFTPQENKTTSYLNPKYTLENFVVGPTNNVAYAAAQAVVQNPGTSYNPLFIYGGTGVGKTHLMLGIGNAILKKYPDSKVNYCSSEKFTNDYIEAIQTRQTGSLRNRYRSIDLLMIDDIQFFSGREGTQEEFFHTFNELSTKNAQIVITSDRPPHEIDKLEDRLKSRFQGGLMVDIQIPDLDTRVAILKAKCQERREFLPEESYKLIAASVETNARALEGRLIQILQLLKTRNLQPSVENIQMLLGKKEEVSINNLSPKQVLIKVCEYFNIKESELVGPKRVKVLIFPRHLTMHILSEELKLTVEKIGQILGGRDHTTVMHGRDKIKRLIGEDEETQRIFTEVRQSLSNI